MIPITKSSVLLTPGPVPIPQEILERFSQPVIHHRTPQFEKTLEYCLAALARMFDSDHAIIQASTGSGGMESAISNLISPGDEVLCVISGKFGERWARMAEVYGAKVHKLEVPWGEAVELGQFEDSLKKYPKVRVVYSQVCETSTATLHPIQAMGALVKEYSNAIFAVDAITAAGCLALPMRKWNIDVMVAGSQKAFMLPTGLSFIGLNEKAVNVAKTSRSPKYYFSWTEELNANAKVQTYFSSPTTLIMGLETFLRKVEQKGIDLVQRRCEALSEATRKVTLAMGLSLFSKAPSPSVTAIQLPSSINGEKLRDWLESEKGVIVMGGQDHLKGKILRVGHMGDIRDEHMKLFFASLSEGLKTFNFEAKSGYEGILQQICSRAGRLFE